MNFKNEIKSILLFKEMSIGTLNDRLNELTGDDCSYFNFTRKLGSTSITLIEVLNIIKILNYSIICEKENLYMNISNQDIQDTGLPFSNFLSSCNILGIKVSLVENDFEE
ncbi:hypothetical protein Q3304_09080 [Clostridioides sp. GD02377]|uniref:hypothetical protein n=1 Tax=unclassified Clostridioides TaxID=2635829 RepID=UPI0038ADEDEF